MFLSFKKIAPAVAQIMVRTAMAALDATVQVGLSAAIVDAVKEMRKDIEETVLNTYPYALQLQDIFRTAAAKMKEFDKMMNDSGEVWEKEMKEKGQAVKAEYEAKRSSIMGPHLTVVETQKE